MTAARGNWSRPRRFDRNLVVIGAGSAGYGLEELGIETTPTLTVETDAWLQSIYPNILACGDVAGPHQFTHAAAHQAQSAVLTALFTPFYRSRPDYTVMPAVTFADPEVARVGLNERDAQALGAACECVRYDLHELDRAIVDGTTEGFLKVLTAPGKDRILGATIVGVHAGETLAEFALAMRHGIGLKGLLNTVHAYPTYAEANRYVVLPPHPNPIATNKERHQHERLDAGRTKPQPDGRAPVHDAVEPVPHRHRPALWHGLGHGRLRGHPDRQCARRVAGALRSRCRRHVAHPRRLVRRVDAGCGRLRLSG
jgi:hypothetical protein